VGLLAAGVALLRRRRRAPAAVPPHERALAELDALAGRAPPPGHPADWYHTRISAVMRKYLEERFSLRASRQTTEEFFAEVGRGEHLNEQQQGLLRDLLAHCDLVKFTGLAPSEAEISQATELARNFVRQTAPSP